MKVKEIFVRPCIWSNTTDITIEKGTHKGLFHQWTNTFGMIEDYNGKVHIIHGSFITFTEDEFYEIKEWKLTNLTTKEF